MDGDPLQRFVAAQQGIYALALDELRAGRKRSHWMWFVFPQLRGLGRSEMAHRYGLVDLAEAQAYARHPLLGTRLRECTQAMLAVPRRSALEVLGSPDDLKFRSCMTLFAQAVPGEPLFTRALERFFDGVPDEQTLARL